LFFTRVLTATVLLAAFIAALFWLERGWFAALAAIVVGLAAGEWAKLLKAQGFTGAVFAVACAAASYALAANAQLAPWVCGLAGLFWIVGAPVLLSRGIRPAPPGAGMAVGVIVLVPAGLALAVLPPGQVLMILGLIWVSDTAAYLAGRAIGRRKLAPAISPGKTWEGVAGGAAGCVIYAIIWASFDADMRSRVQGLVWLPYLAGTLLLCALGVVGDLLESGLKRQAGAKDSGRLLPGHGGVLDRIDSATAALPVGLVLMQSMGTT
jgi:phosphatidate cytidylyltransferase